MLAQTLKGDLVNLPAGSGGSSSPGLPVWTFQASDGSDPDDGKFTTDNSHPNATAQIKFSQVSKNGGFPGLAFAQLAPHLTTIVLVGSNGEPECYEIESVTAPQVVTFGVGTSGVGNTAWQGDYQISFMAYGPTLAPILQASNITPIADGANDGAITTVQGTVTAVTPVNSGDGTFQLSATLGGSITILNGRVTSFTPAS